MHMTSALLLWLLLWCLTKLRSVLLRLAVEIDRRKSTFLPHLGDTVQLSILDKHGDSQHIPGGESAAEISPICPSASYTSPT
jgi:hypothetical protein